MRRLATIVLMTTALLGSAAAPLAAADTYPDVIPLPNGFFPEGIAVGHGHTFYAGSLVDGAIWAGDLRTGEGGILAYRKAADAVRHQVIGVPCVVHADALVPVCQNVIGISESRFRCSERGLRERGTSQIRVQHHARGVHNSSQR